MAAGSILWLAGAMAVFIAANSTLRAYAGGGAVWVLAVALAMFCLGNLMMVRLMRESGLALAISVSSVGLMYDMAGTVVLCPMVCCEPGNSALPVGRNL